VSPASARAIGRYQIEAEAASGAAGTVYQALDRTTGARVAVKVLRGLSVADTARFAREARLLAQIRHPAVVRYVDHGTTDEGAAYLVMEWLEGEDLRRRLSRVGISMGETVVLGQRVAEALAAIHAHEVVHRDVKPANIFLPGGLVAEAKVIDFGLVYSEWASAEVTMTGMVVGTPSYMAPEQARGQRLIDARADLFSLGCVLYKCLTGRAPFEGTSVLAVLTKVLLEDAVPVRVLRPEIPRALGDLVMRLIQKDLAQRPESAAAVARELGAMGALAALADLDGGTTPAPPSAVFSGLTTSEQRVVAVLLIGAARAAPPGEVTLLTATRAGALPDLAPLVEIHGGLLDVLLDGTRVVTLPAARVAAEQVVGAARCALAVRAVLPDAPMAIGTSRGEISALQPGGGAIERAAGLLAAAAASAASERAVIAVDELTTALLGPRFEVVAGGAGLHLERERAGESALPTLLGRATPMVGRDWELGSIRSLFATCVEEHAARPVLVTGAAGMGKSRLGHEAVGAVRDVFPDVLVWWGRGDPLRAGSALGVLGQIVCSAAGVEESAPLSARRSRLAERLAPWLPEHHAESMIEVLGEVSGSPFAAEASPALRAARQDARLMSDQVRASWEALCAGAAAARPLLVVIEDLQWADAATVRLLGAALASLGHLPWMLLALARPEVHDALPRLWEGRDLQEIRLAPLARRAAERLARLALGEGASADTIQRLARQADGNAFYLEELIRAVATSAPAAPPASPAAAVVEAAAPAEEVAAEGRSRALPETVLAMVEARLSGLDAGTRRVLRAASVFGQVFWPGGVTALLGGSQPQNGWIDLLIERELCVARTRSRFAGERELVFRHALLREGAYAMLTESDRVLGHGLAGEWLDRHGERDAMVLAQHFEIARDDRRAAELYLAAAVQSLRAADIDWAIRRAGRALAQAPTEAARIACLSLLCEAYAWRDDWARALPAAEELTVLAAPGSVAWINAMAMKQSAALNLGRPDELLVTLMALMTVEGGPGTATALVPALAVTVFLLSLAGQAAMAAGVHARMGALVAAHSGDEPLLRGTLALAHVWVAAWGQGDAWAALRSAEEAHAAAEETRNTPHTRFAQVFVAMSRWSLGRYGEAEADLRAFGPVDGDDLLAVLAALYLALVLVEQGELDEARELAQRRLEMGVARPEGNGALREAEGRWLLGEVAARAGDLEAAERELSRCLPVLQVSVLVWQIAAARLAQVRLGLGRVAEALAIAGEAVASLATAGGPGLRGTLVRLAHVEALEAAGDDEAARRALRVAWEDLDARAARIGDAEVRATFLTAVPENARVTELARDWLGIATLPGLSEGSGR
jgi:tetratricopeptide (TPR) repeat protein